jgi:putative PEP-CTERM system histidine kinase
VTGTQTVLLLGTLSLAVPLIAVAIRRGSAILLMATAVSGLSFGAFFVSLHNALAQAPGRALTGWMGTAVGAGIPIALSGILLTSCLGRRDPERAVREQKWVHLLLAGSGVLFLSLMHGAGFIRGLDVSPSHWRIAFGPWGTVYLGYLLVGIVVSGYNLERTYREAGDARVLLRVPFFGIFCVLGYFVYLLTLSILYSVVSVNLLAASAIPVTLAGLLIGHGFLRGGLRDAAVPVSRKLIYSSLSVIAAAFYLLAVGILAQIAVYLRWSAGEVIGVTLSAVLAGSSLLFLFSSRIQRRVRRFVDLNFYVNRYDYRSHWALLTEHLSRHPSTGRILESARFVLESTFQPREITIAMADRAGGDLRPVLGKGTGNGTVLRKGEPLHGVLLRERRSVILGGRADDFEYIPIYAENDSWLRATAGHVVAPLLAGEELIGVVGLGLPRHGGRYTFEALDLLDRMGAHLAALLHNARLSEALAEAREMELLSNWSSFLLHDLKNQLSPLRMIELNLARHGDNPIFREVAQRDLGHIRERMESLTRRLSELRDGPQLGQDVVDVNPLLREILDEYKMYERDGLGVALDLRADRSVAGDRSMLQRVFENLITNGVEAMPEGGTLALATHVAGEDPPRVCISVHDTGVGMTEEFLRDRLFRPFATSKRRGLGLGLYQCRSIVRAHGGEITVESRPGEGSTFRILLPAGEPMAQVEPAAPPVAGSGSLRLEGSAT